MNIKSLLLGSAAAMAVVSGASAADAIIAAEPEPVEYVRVCDAFGSGYFYIPGTETCLKIGGLVRMDITYADNSIAKQTSGANSYGTSVRGRVEFRSRTDTEMGTIGTHVRLQGDGGSSTPGTDASAVVDQAYATVGGLVFGYTESVWVSSKNGGDSGFGTHSDNGLAYGYQQHNQLGYNFGSGNWFGAISLQDDGDASSFAPDITGRLGGVWGGITIYGVVGYDQSAENFGAKLGLNTDVGSAGNIIVQGFYANGPTVFGANASAPIVAGTTNGSYTPEWSVLASYQHVFSSTFKAAVGGQYSGDYYSTPLWSTVNATGVTTATQTALGSAKSGVNSWALEGGVVWTPVENFEVRGEVRYTKVNNLGVGLIDNGFSTLLRLERRF
jgi:hypothetical protein